VGLDISVGMLADLLINDEEGGEWLRGEIDRLNELLEGVHLERHVDPEETDSLSISTYGYSGLHHLRRCAAHLQYSGTLPSGFSRDEEPATDALYLRYAREFNLENAGAPPGTFAFSSDRCFDHLIMHSDAEGYYVPQDFEQVLIASPAMYAWIGSSPALKREFERLASALELPAALLADSEDLAFEEAIVMATNEQPLLGSAPWQRHPVAAMLCAKLHNVATHSIRTGALVVFC